jgi:type I restriction enzyme R subunit
MTQTNEQAFESYVETILLDQAGWRAGDVAEWDLDRALFPARIFAFLRETQPALWAQMETLHGAGLESLLLNTLVKELDLKGTLHILRRGFKFYGKTFRLAYFQPAHGLNYEIVGLYGKNRLTVTRQVPCDPDKHDTVDFVFAINGVPVATCELKNPSTGQHSRHAVRQYREDRDPRAPLFNFKTRALVHFAADPDEVHMTTRLAGEATLFLPFNRGSHPGAAKSAAHSGACRQARGLSQVRVGACEGGRTHGVLALPAHLRPGEPSSHCGRIPDSPPQWKERSWDQNG